MVIDIVTLCVGSPLCRANAGSLADLVKTVEESRIPVVAAISGLAYGGGVSARPAAFPVHICTFPYDWRCMIVCSWSLRWAATTAWPTRWPSWHCRRSSSASFLGVAGHSDCPGRFTLIVQSCKTRWCTCISCDSRWEEGERGNSAFSNNFSWCLVLGCRDIPLALPLSYLYVDEQSSLSLRMLVWWLCRLVGVERAVRMIVTGEPISAKEAMAAG